MKRCAILIVLAMSLSLAGCNEQQLERVDQMAADVNQWSEVVGPAIQSAPLPPAVKAYGALACIIGSAGTAAWQTWRKSQMQKTTKAIVKGIEQADRDTKNNPVSEVKAAIGVQMRAAKIYDQGNKIVDKLKIA